MRLRFSSPSRASLPVLALLTLFGAGAGAGASAALVSACAEPNFEVEEEEPPLPDRVVDPPPTNPFDDAGDGAAATRDSGADAAADASDGAPRTLHAFVSSAIMAGGSLGGLAGADTKCTMLAAAQGLTGTYRAWLSVAGTNAADRITGAGPWLRVDGEVAIASRAALLGGTLSSALDIDEKGDRAPGAEDRAWTATKADGTFEGPDCSGWTMNSSSGGRVGEAEYADSRWTRATVESCGQVNRIYCFEQ